MSFFLSLDPGYDRCGWAIFDVTSKKMIEFGCIVTHKKDAFHDRLSTICTQINALFEAYQTVELAMENLYFSKNVTTALKVAEVRGAMIALASLRQIKIFEYNPNQIKQTITGYGKADKKAIEKMIRLELKIDAKEKILDDAFDAVAVGLTHLSSRNSLR